MDENLNTEQIENKNSEQTQEPQYTEIQLKAIEQGWIPKEEFDGDDSEFIDAPEFVRRGELFDKIERQSRELKAVRQALEAFKVHHSKVKETEYERALKTLKDARKQAFLDGEHERAFALEEKIDEIQAEKQQVLEEARQPIQEPNEYTAQFTEWVGRNNWYETNRTMRAAADALGVQLHQAGHSPEEVLRMVEKEIKQEFAHRFQNPNTAKPPAVESSTRGTPKRESFQLSSDERDIMRKIVATGVMTEEEYIKDLKAMRS